MLTVVAESVVKVGAVFVVHLLALGLNTLQSSLAFLEEGLSCLEHICIITSISDGGVCLFHNLAERRHHQIRDLIHSDGDCCGSNRIVLECQVSAGYRPGLSRLYRKSQRGVCFLVFTPR